jgi:7-carboxy-7-deazaguanine synthase
VWCDTPQTQAFAGGRTLKPSMVADMVRVQACPNVTITGGEPLIDQQGVLELIEHLIPQCDITIETNGSIQPPIWAMWADVTWVCDYKLPGSGMETAMFPAGHLADNLPRNPRPWVKFVVTDERDLTQARRTARIMRSVNRSIRFAISPAQVEGGPDMGLRIVQFIMEYGLWDFVLNVQLHKIVGVK